MLRKNETGTIPSPGNPYVDHGDEYVGPRQFPEPAAVTMRDVDRMVRAKLDDAQREAREKTRRKCLRAWEDGRRDGHCEGFARAQDGVAQAVTQVISRHLIWTERRLDDRLTAKRTTIQAERDFQARILGEVSAAINALLMIEGTER